MLTLKFVSEFSQEVLKLESLNLVYGWMIRIDNQANCCHNFQYLSIFLSFQGNLCQFSQELLKIEFSTVVNIM